MFLGWSQIRVILGLNSGLSSNFWWLKNANHVKFTEKCVMCRKKHVLIPKLFTNGLTWVCYSEPELKRQSMEWEHPDSPVKTKFQAQQPVKKVILDCFLGHERIDCCWFPWKRVLLKILLPIAISFGKNHFLYWITLVYLKYNWLNFKVGKKRPQLPFFFIIIIIFVALLKVFIYVVKFFFFFFCKFYKNWSLLSVY